MENRKPTRLENRIVKSIVNRIAMTVGEPTHHPWEVRVSSINPKLKLRFQPLSNRDAVFVMFTPEWELTTWLDHEHVAVKRLIEGNLDAFDRDFILIRMEFE